MLIFMHLMGIISKHSLTLYKEQVIPSLRLCYIMNKRQKIGVDGEQRARAFLETQGFCFIGANYRSRWGEIDLLMKDGKWLVFVEVKTRRSKRFGEPLESITIQKQRKLIKTAQDYLLKNPYDGPVRFDVVGISLNSDQERIEHIPNALETV